MQRIHGVDQRDAPRRDPLPREGQVHVERAELQERCVRETRLQRLLAPPHEEWHELGEAIFADVRPSPGASELVEKSRRAAAEPAAELHDDDRGWRHQLGHRGGAHEVVHDVEAVVVGEEVHPQAKPARREEHLFAGALAPQEHGIILRDRLGQYVRRLPGGVLAALCLEDLGRIELGHGSTELEA